MSEKEDWNFVFDMMRTAHTNFKNKGEKSNIPFVDVSWTEIKSGPREQEMHLLGWTVFIVDLTGNAFMLKMMSKYS